MVKYKRAKPCFIHACSLCAKSVRVCPFCSFINFSWYCKTYSNKDFSKN